MTPKGSVLEGGGVRKLRRNLKESVVGEVVREETTTHSQRLLGKNKNKKPFGGDVGGTFGDVGGTSGEPWAALFLRIS